MQQQQQHQKTYSLFMRIDPALAESQVVILSDSCIATGFSASSFTLSSKAVWIVGIPPCHHVPRAM